MKLALAAVFVCFGASPLFAQGIQGGGSLVPHAHTGANDGGANISPTGVTTIPVGSTLTVQGSFSAPTAQNFSISGTTFTASGIQLSPGATVQTTFLQATGNISFSSVTSANLIYNTTSTVLGLDSSITTANFGPCVAGSTITATVGFHPLRVWGSGNVSCAVNAGCGVGFLVNGQFIFPQAAGAPGRGVGQLTQAAAGGFTNFTFEQLITIKSSGSISMCLTAANSGPNSVTFSPSAANFVNQYMWGFKEEY